MISIARASLRYESRRYLAALLALAFSGLLILVEVGLTFGMFRTYTLPVEQSRADLWVTSANAESFDESANIPSRTTVRFWLHPEVKDVQEMPPQSSGEWRGRGGTRQFVFIVPVNTKPGSLIMPRDFTEEMRVALEKPGSVIIDEADVAKLGTGLGGIAEINQKRVQVAALARGFRAVSGSFVFVSTTTLRLLESSGSSDDPSFVLIALKDPSRAEEVRKQLRPADSVPPYRVWTREELVTHSQMTWMAQGGSGVTFAFSAVLALMIGVGITSQTLRAAVLGSIREYAALRALGVTVGQLRWVVLEKSFWLGLFSLAVTGAAIYAVANAASSFAIPISYPWPSVAGTAVLIMLIALSSGALSLRVLYKSEPAELLR